MTTKIGFLNRKLQGICTQKKKAAKHLPGHIKPELLFQRLNELHAFANLGEIPFQTTPLHFHPLREDQRGRFAVTLHGKYRIVFEPAGTFERNDDGTPIKETVTEITIYAVEDYHGK